MGGKAAAASVTIWAAAVVILAQIVKLFFGYNISPDDQRLIVSYIQQVVEIISTVASLLGGIAAILGRIRATRPITSIIVKPASTGGKP